MTRDGDITDPERQPGEAMDRALRPTAFDDFTGQEAAKANLKVFVSAARKRGDALDHVLLSGPPGLGKTTLAQILSREMGVGFRSTSGPVIAKAGDLAALLTNLEPRDVLFIDEIHRLPAVVEEYLYPAMEDFKVDVTLDQGANARMVTVPLQPFTLIGATTRLGLLTGPMRGRFGLCEHIEFYDPKALHQILKANAMQLKLQAEDKALWELATRSRGTPRVANRLLRRVRDFAAVESDGILTLAIVRKALDLEAIDARGLDEQDRTFLRTIIDVYAGGPVGIDAVAATMGEERDTLEDVIEPYLLQQALVTRTRQGRRVTRNAYAHLGLPPPAHPDDEPSMFE
jgi:holliday junction DNA helicase RuvB